MAVWGRGNVGIPNRDVQASMGVNFPMKDFFGKHMRNPAAQHHVQPAPLSLKNLHMYVMPR